jgi:hypothetical protein
MHNRILALFLCLLASPLFAQEGYEHLSPLSHGAGRTYVVNSRGLDAIGLNPALLALGSKKSWELSILPVSSLGADAGASFLSDKLTQLANNTADLDSGGNFEVADLLRDDRLSGRADARILAAYYHQPDLGGFAFAFSTHSGVRTQIPEEVLTLLTDLLYFTARPLRIADIDAQGLWYNSWSFSYGRELFGGESSALTVGAAVKYLQGLGYLRLEEGAYLETAPLGFQNIQIKANYQLRYSYIDIFDRRNNTEDITIFDVFSGGAGSGIGFDLGAAYRVGGDGKNPAVIIAASVNDIGSISWSENTIERNASAVIDTINYQNTNPQYIADTLAAFAGNVRNIGSFTTNLPTTLRIGASMNLRQLGIIPKGPEITFAAELNKGLTSVVGSLDDARIGIGAIALWDLPVIDIRTAAGMVFESEVVDVTLGAGVTVADVVSFDVSSARLAQLFNAGEGRSDVAFGFKLHL